MASKGGSVDTPVFDFGRMSRGWRLAWSEVQIAVSEVQLDLQAGLDSDAGLDVMRERVSLMRKMQALAAEQAVLVAQVLVSVPDDWLAEGAPEGLDWRDPTSLDHLQEDKYADLLTALGSARRENSKN